MNEPRAGAHVDLVDFAGRMAELLVKLEAELWADARQCPLCSTCDPSMNTSGLVHAPDCELDAILRDAGLRRFFSSTG